MPLIYCPYIIFIMVIILITLYYKQRCLHCNTWSTFYWFLSTGQYFACLHFVVLCLVTQANGALSPPRLTSHIKSAKQINTPSFFSFRLYVNSLCLSSFSNRILYCLKFYTLKHFLHIFHNAHKRLKETFAGVPVSIVLCGKENVSPDWL